jgi:hypothetical protein
VIVLKKKTLTIEQLERMARSKDLNRRFEAYTNPGATSELLAQGARDKDWLIRYVVMKKDRLPLRCLVERAMDENEHVRLIAAQRLRVRVKDEVPLNSRWPIEVSRERARDKDMLRRAFLMIDCTMPLEILEIGANDPEPLVRWAVMNNPRTTREMLEMGLKDNDADVQKAAKFGLCSWNWGEGLISWNE